MSVSTISLFLVMQLGFGLEDGTPIKMRITRTLSSADAKVDDRVDFEVLEEIKVGDVVVIPRGGLALATVTEAQSKRRMGRAGKLNVNIDTVRLVSGEKIPLRAVKEVKGGGNQGKMTGAIVATSIVFFPAAPLFLFVHGKDITIPKGTEITGYVNGNAPLDPAKFASTKPAPLPAPVAATTAIPVASETPAPIQTNNNLAPLKVSLSTAKISIASETAGAEIEVDGQFVGNTPTTLELSEGNHKIVVKQASKVWQREIRIHSGSSITVNAVFEKPAESTATVTSPAETPKLDRQSSVVEVIPRPNPEKEVMYLDCGDKFSGIPFISSYTFAPKKLKCGEEVMVMGVTGHWTRIRTIANVEGNVESRFVSRRSN